MTKFAVSVSCPLSAREYGVLPSCGLLNYTLCQSSTHIVNSIEISSALQEELEHGALPVVGGIASGCGLSVTHPLSAAS